MLSTREEKELIDLCSSLIAIKSYSGEEGELATMIKEYLQAICQEVWVDALGNVIGHMPGGKGKTVLFDTHMDVVPAEDGHLWESPPFQPQVRHNRIYGRGATDMKGAIAGILMALTYLKRHSLSPPGPLFFASSVHEECFEGVASQSVAEKVHPHYVIIGEPTDLNVHRGQKGRAEIKITVHGRAGHTADPENGINAVYHMSRLIQRIQNSTMPESPFLGRGILELTDIQSYPFPGNSVIPERSVATYDRRTLVGETPEDILQPIQELMATMAAENRDFKGTVEIAKETAICYTGQTMESSRFFNAWEIPEEHELVQGSLAILTQNGLSPRIDKFNCCTNGSYYAGTAGIPTIGFGPSHFKLAHITDEYIDIPQLIQATNGFIALAKGLGNL